MLLPTLPSLTCCRPSLASATSSFAQVTLDLLMHHNKQFLKAPMLRHYCQYGLYSRLMLMCVCMHSLQST